MIAGSDVKTVQGEGFIDQIAIYDSPGEYGLRLLVWREYERVREGLDLQGDVGWVRFNRARNGMKL